MRNLRWIYDEGGEIGRKGGWWPFTNSEDYVWLCDKSREVMVGVREDLCLRWVCAFLGGPESVQRECKYAE